MLELSSEEGTLVLKTNDTKINVEKLKTKSITAEKEGKQEIISHTSQHVEIFVVEIFNEFKVTGASPQFT